MSQENNLFWQSSRVTRASRERLNKHRGAALWFTGLSAAGKSTLAYNVEEKLYALGCHTFVLDGDNMRQGLCSDLGFSDQDRTENIRRVAEAAKLFAQSGVITLAAFISPISKDRKNIQSQMEGENFFQIYCRCPLEVCEQRDPKGLYKKARKGLIKDFTGISSVYEEPQDAHLVLETGLDSVEDCANQVIQLLKMNSIIN